MDNRKMYVRPAVESEEMLEQTSLACNATQEYDPQQKPRIYAIGLDCLTDVSKGGAFAFAACETNLPGPEAIVVLS